MPIKTLNFKQSLLIGAFIYVSAALLTACQRGIVANPKDENTTGPVLQAGQDNGQTKPATTAAEKFNANSSLGSGLKKVAPAQANQTCDLNMKKADIQIMEENFKILSKNFKIQLKQSIVQDLTNAESAKENQKTQKIVVDVFGIKSKNSASALIEQVKNLQLMIAKYKKSETNPGCFTEAEESNYPAILRGIQSFLTSGPEVQNDCDDEKIQNDLNFIASVQKALEQKGILLNLGIFPKQERKNSATPVTTAVSSEKEKQDNNTQDDNAIEIEILKQLESRLQSLEKIPSASSVDVENGVSVACSVPVEKLNNLEPSSLKETVLMFDEAHISKKVLDADITSVQDLLKLLEVADDGVITNKVAPQGEGIQEEELAPLKKDAVKTPEQTLAPVVPVPTPAPTTPAPATDVKKIPEFQRKSERMGVNSNIDVKPSIASAKVSAKKESTKKKPTSGKKGSGNKKSSHSSQQQKAVKTKATAKPAAASKATPNSKQESVVKPQATQQEQKIVVPARAAVKPVAPAKALAPATTTVPQATPDPKSKSAVVPAPPVKQAPTTTPMPAARPQATAKPQQPAPQKVVNPVTTLNPDVF